MVFFTSGPITKKMIWAATSMALVLGFAAPAQSGSTGSAGPPWNQTVAHRWSTFELELQGPLADEANDNPNPFLDYRLNVTFASPSGRIFEVPGFFDGDGKGSGVGKVWKVRFTPDEDGPWTYEVSFRQGTDLAVNPWPLAGSPLAPDGQAGKFRVQPPEPDAEGFFATGMLEYVDQHYLRFQSGKYFLKTGTNSPENLLGYAGFDNVQDMGGYGIIHKYADHVADWNPGDPVAGAVGSPSGLKGIVGALNYLSEVGVNAVYFLPMNLGGDGQETAPFLGYLKTPYDKTHYDVSRLEQWNTVFAHAMRKGILLQFVLSETESENESWLDAGAFGIERQLFFRELIARFAHHQAIKWNLGEENDFVVDMLDAMAGYIQDLDPYDHPITVHTHADDFSDYIALLGNPHFSATSIQYSNDLAGKHVEEWRAHSAGSDRPWVLDMDENGTPEIGASDTNAELMRKTILYDVLFSGGQIEWYLGSIPVPVGGDQDLEDFRTREDLWTYSAIAREWMEDELKFWLMEPADDLLSGEDSNFGGGEVFHQTDGNIAVYLPDAQPSGNLDLGAKQGQLFEQRWFNPRTGLYNGGVSYKQGGQTVALGSAPFDANEDWVVLLRRVPLLPVQQEVSVSSPAPIQDLMLDGTPAHAFESYQVLTTGSGIVPGTEFLGVHLPLNWDVLTSFTWSNPVSPYTSGFSGQLNYQGRAQAQLNLAGVFGASSVGTVLFHAYLAGPAGQFKWASNPVPLVVVP